MSEKYALREIKAYVDEQIQFSEDRIKRHFNTMIDDLRVELKETATRTATRVVKEAGGESNALTIPEAAKRELTVSVRKEVTREVYEFLDKTVMPRIDNAIAYMHMKNEDGDELVTRYRRELHKTVNKGDRKAITGGNSADTRLHDYQKETLFFTEND